jgi:protein arginine kinase
MGIHLGLIADLDISTINKLFIHLQPAHLQKLTRFINSNSQRNIERANYLHSLLKSRKSTESN